MEFDLVFEGGGAKGGAFTGALRAFERHGHKPRRLIGSSAGSIVATLVAAGYSAQDCLEALEQKLPDGRSVFASFLDTPNIDADDEMSEGIRSWLITELDNPDLPNSIEPFVDSMMNRLIGQEFFRHLLSLLLWGGWYSGKAFRSWLRERLDQDGRGLADSTLLEFHQKTGSDLSAVAADVTGKEMLVLNHRTAPNCPTVWAIRMSMGCPFAWPEVTWHAEWGLYRGRDLTGHRVVDGGLLSNFPIRLFVSSDENIDEIMGENSISDQVIGLLIDETLPVPGIEEPLRDAAAPGFIGRLDLLQQTLWRVQGLADTVLGGNDRTVLAAYQDMVCRLPAKGVGTLDFDMPAERMAALVTAAEAAMEAYLAARPA
jgi:predicted acylesterase/phospholipase RssA